MDRFNPDYVVILSGDHIYKMDYAAMVAYHEKHKASCTIAVRSVPLAEASRFGILNTNPDNTIYEFEEKPAKPKSTNASMGIYCFNWQVLRDALIADEENPSSANDFGKNIIPSLLADGHKMMAYPFDGYWKDVGTIDSLWEANMDLLGKEPAFQLRGDKRSTIYARNSAMPSSYIDEQAEIVNAFVAEGSGGLRHRPPQHHLHRLHHRRGCAGRGQRRHARRGHRVRRHRPPRHSGRGLQSLQERHRGRRLRRRGKEEDQRHVQGRCRRKPTPC